MSANICEWMRRPEAYPDRPTAVELIETHISWVFLAGRHAYKLKKPVSLGFLDFSTEQLRRQACEAETRLNRRLAPQVYLGNVPVTINRAGKFQLGGEGQIVDWVVKMHRLQADHALDQRIEKQTLDLAEFDRLSDRLNSFFAGLPPVSLEAESYCRRLEDHVQGNRDELQQPRHGLDPVLVRRIHGAQQRWLKLSPQVLKSRVCDGRIVEGHGDLRPEHVYLNSQPVVIDCLEFSQELRQIDVVDELGFLAMELQHLGRPDLGDRLLERYVDATHDRPPDELWAFYRSYRACVRAKVAALRANQQETKESPAPSPQAVSYLQQALEHTSALNSSLVIVMSGLMGSGKSTLASALAETLDLEWLQTDAVRREIFGASPDEAGFEAGVYRPENRRRVYDETIARARTGLREGLSVLLDGTFLTADSLHEAANLAAESGASLCVVRCVCPDDIARARIASRCAAGGALSEARPELYDLQKQQLEPVPAEFGSCEIDTTVETAAAIELVLETLRAGR